MAATAKPRWKKWAIRLGIALPVMYLAICAVMYFAQDFLLFHPTVVPQDQPWDLSVAGEGLPNETVETIDYAADLDGKLSGLLFKVPDSKGVVVYFHGNGGNAAICAKNRTPFLERGWDVFFADYRGYGRSTGPLSQEGLDADAEAAWEAMASRYPEPHRRIIYGQSMGSGFATRLAARHTPHKLILETPYTSLVGVAQWQYPWLPVGMLFRYPSEAKTAVGSVQSEVFVIHGTADRTIPYEMGKEMTSAAHKARLFTVPDGGHNDCRKSPEFRALLDVALR